jgi:hypothetical protein
LRRLDRATTLPPAGEIEGEPRVPSVGAMLGGELLVAFEIDIALIMLVERNEVTYLRTDAGYA